VDVWTLTPFQFLNDACHLLHAGLIEGAKQLVRPPHVASANVIAAATRRVANRLHRTDAARIVIATRSGGVIQKVSGAIQRMTEEAHWIVRVILTDQAFARIEMARRRDGNLAGAETAAR
jgi:hypothetical protein